MNKIKFILTISFLIYSCGNRVSSKDMFQKMKFLKSIKLSSKNIKINKNRGLYLNLAKHSHGHSKDNLPYFKLLYCLIGFEYIKQQQQEKRETNYIEAEKK